MALESPDWEQILEMLPVGENEDMEDKRRFSRYPCFCSCISSDPLREMWLLMDLDDSGFLTLRELARGVPTITQVGKVIQRHFMYSAQMKPAHYPKYFLSTAHCTQEKVAREKVFTTSLVFYQMGGEGVVKARVVEKKKKLTTVFFQKPFRTSLGPKHVLRVSFWHIYSYRDRFESALGPHYWIKE